MTSGPRANRDKYLRPGKAREVGGMSEEGERSERTGPSERCVREVSKGARKAQEKRKSV